MEIDPARASEMALMQCMVLREAIHAIFVTHPKPALLLRVFEENAKDHADEMPFSEYSEESLDFATELRQRFIDQLRARLANK